MKNSQLSFLGGIVLLSIAAFFIFQNKGLQNASRSTDVQGSVASEQKAQTQNQDKHTSKVPDLSQPKEDANLALPKLSKEECLQAIHDASVTYDPAELPKINVFLGHEDPEVRHAAVQGMITLGDSKAAPYLREAAKSAATAKEAVAFEEAAQYMELPPARHFKLRKLKPEAK